MLYSTVSIIIAAKWANFSWLQFSQLEGEAAISLQASLYPTTRRMKTCKWRSSHNPASAAFYNLPKHNICMNTQYKYTLLHLTSLSRLFCHTLNITLNATSRCMKEWKPYLSVDVHTWMAYGNKLAVFSLVTDWMALNGIVSCGIKMN